MESPKRGCFPITESEKGHSGRRDKQRQNLRTKIVRCIGETVWGPVGAGSNIHTAQAHELGERSRLKVIEYRVVGTVANWKPACSSPSLPLCWAQSPFFPPDKSLPIEGRL